MTALANDGSNRAMYHAGMVVPDLEQTVQTYSDLFGLRFARPRLSSLDVRVDGVPRHCELTVSYSLNGPPYLELIQERAGSVWAADALNLNHIGFWAPDLRLAARRLEDSGLAARVHDIGADGGMTRFSYHRGADGIWVELVAPAFQAQLTAWLAASAQG